MVCFPICIANPTPPTKIYQLGHMTDHVTSGANYLTLVHVSGALVEVRERGEARHDTEHGPFVHFHVSGQLMLHDSHMTSQCTQNEQLPLDQSLLMRRQCSYKPKQPHQAER